jgi:hypothetical protein
MIISVPKISTNHHDHSSSISYDYFLGDIRRIDTVLYYNTSSSEPPSLPKMESIDNLNEFSWIGTDYYTKHIINITKNTGIASVLYIFSPTFSLMTSTSEINTHIQEFRKQMGLDLVEKGLFKSLNLSAYKIKRKALMESLFKLNNDMDMEPDEHHMFLSYICARFNICILIVSEDYTFQELKPLTTDTIDSCNINYIIILKMNKNGKTSYSPLLSKSGDTNLIPQKNARIIMKLMISQLTKKIQCISTLKVAQLNELASKMGLRTTGLKRDELIAVIHQYIL